MKIGTKVTSLFGVTGTVVGLGPNPDPANGQKSIAVVCWDNGVKSTVGVSSLTVLA